jgi:proline iminopeptidase
MRARIRDSEFYLDIDGAALVPDGPLMRERPTAFVIHGGAGVDHTGLNARHGRLTERLHLVYFDHRGQGRSARGDPKKYTPDENVEDIEALREYRVLDTIVSIDTSYGGMAATACAARYPKSVSHLILVATSAQAGNVARAKQIAAERGTPQKIAQCNNLYTSRLNTPEKVLRYFEVMGPLYSCTADPALSATHNGCRRFQFLSA